MVRPMQGLLAGALVLLAVACGPGATAPLTEPREILTRGLQTTAALGTVRLGIDVVYRAGPAQQVHIGAEGDVDMRNRELDLVASVEPAVFDMAQARFVIADGFVFTRGGTSDWSVSGGTGEDPLDSVPTTARIAAALYAAVADPRTVATLGVAEPCGAVTCYRLTVELPPEVLWGVPQALIDGLAAQPMPAGIPSISLDTWIEHESFLILKASTSMTLGSSSADLTLHLSNHNRSVQIVAPADAPLPVP